MRIRKKTLNGIVYLLMLALSEQAASAEWVPPAPGQIHNQGPILIKNVRVFDGINPRLIEQATVLIDYVRTPDRVSGTGSIINGYDVGYFIKEIAENRPLKTAYDQSRVRVIDGNNKVLMPGLIDTHIHLGWQKVGYILGFAKKMNAPGSTLNMQDWLIEDKRDPSDPNFVPNAITATKEQAWETLKRGFTSVREVGGVALRVRPAIDPHEAPIDAGNPRGAKQLVLGLPGPRIWAAGAVISATAGHADLETDLAAKFKLFKDPDMMTLVERQELVYQLDRYGLRTADGVGEVQRAVRDQFVKGADMIKITTGGGVSSPHDPIDATTFDNDEVTAAVEVAKGYNTYVTTHAYGGHTIVRDISRGVRMIEHANLLNDAAARMVKRKENKKDENGINVGPWLGISSFFDNEYANPKEGISIEKQKQVQQGTLKTYMLAKKYHLNNVAWGADVIFEVEGGVKSPKMIAHLPQDLAPLKKWKNEKGQMVNYSYSNFDILKIVTANNGRVLEMSGLRSPYLGSDGFTLKNSSIGVIKKDSVADLILVDGNPLESLDVFNDVEKNLVMIMKDGVVYKKDGVIYGN